MKLQQLIRTYLNIIALFIGGLIVSACSDSNPGITTSVGQYTMQVRTTPNPLEVGKHAKIQAVLRDSENKPASGCRAKFRQFMPGMGMSLDNTFVVLEEEGNTGSYTGTSSEFSMGGDWVLEFSLQCGDQTHTSQLSYHLEWPE